MCFIGKKHEQLIKTLSINMHMNKKPKVHGYNQWSTSFTDVCICMCTYTHMEARGNLGCHPEEHCPPFNRWGPILS